jgi:hypothetical protein
MLAVPVKKRACSTVGSLGRGRVLWGRLEGVFALLKVGCGDMNGKGCAWVTFWKLFLSWRVVVGKLIS